MSKSSQSISQEQQLGLRLNPQQVRFGRLLEMSAPEYEEEVARALDENPALEAVGAADDAQLHKDDEGRDFTESAEELQRADYGSDEEVPYYRQFPVNDIAFSARYEPAATDSGSAAFPPLESQLVQFDGMTPAEREAATYVIGNLDSNGYLTRSIEAIADDMAMGAGLDVSARDVEHAWNYVRRLDPAGVGAVDLRDCLSLQIDRLMPSGTTLCAAEILRDYFDLFAKKHFDKIKEAMDYPSTIVDDAVRLIRSLNPKPGAQLETSGADDRMRHITPDFIIETDGAGNVSVALAGRVPELAIEETFALPGANEEAETFLRERRESAREFISMNQRRASTLMAVMEAIVRLQPAYFRSFDRQDLRPMVLRDIREATGLDLSVISRATASKYAMTPAGMVSLKSLFSESVSDSGDLSSHTVESRIRKLISGEDKSRPMSDEEIAVALQDDGLNVARRTVAKYRERMGFPVARLRKE